MIETLPCAIESTPSVGSQGMSSGAAGDRDPAPPRLILPRAAFVARRGAKAHSNGGSSGSSVRSLTESRPPRPLAGRSLDQESRAMEGVRGRRPMANFPELRPGQRSAEAERIAVLRDASPV